MDGMGVWQGIASITVPKTKSALTLTVRADMCMPPCAALP